MVEWEPPTCKPEDSPCFGLRLRAKFLMRNFKEVEAGRACVRTSFIIMILAFASVFFSQDTQNLVVAPIEKMVNIVKQLADDPLRKPELPDEEEAHGPARDDYARDDHLEDRGLAPNRLRRGRR